MLSLRLIVRAALICVACDIPAACADLLAIKGCSKCLKSFSTEHFGEKADFSGFDRENWELRNANSHRMRTHTGVLQKNTLLLRHKQLKLSLNGSMVVGTVAYLSCHYYLDPVAVCH